MADELGSVPDSTCRSHVKRNVGVVDWEARRELSVAVRIRRHRTATEILLHWPAEAEGFRIILKREVGVSGRVQGALDCRDATGDVSIRDDRRILQLVGSAVRVAGVVRRGVT